MRSKAMLFLALAGAVVCSTLGCDNSSTLTDPRTPDTALARRTRPAKPTAGDTAPTPAPAPAPSPSSARSADDFVSSIGINTHLSYLNTVYANAYSTVVRPKLQELGVRHVRDGGTVWPDANWMNLVYGRYRDLATSFGIKFDVVMSPLGGTGNYTDASHISTLLSYIGADNVDAFEGLNEHDLSSDPAWATEIAQMQKAIYTYVKGNPTLASKYLVLGPSFVYSSSPSSVGDLSGYMDDGVAHPYPGGNIPSSAVTPSRLQWLATTDGSHPLMATETGYNNALQTTNGHLPVSESAAGKYIPRLFLENYKAGLVRSYSYELIDEGTSNTDIEQSFGLLRQDGSEKPAFVALRNLIAVLADPGPAFPVGNLSYALSGDTTSVHQLLLQKRDGRFDLVLWQEVSSFNLQNRTDVTVTPRSVTVTLPSAPRQVKIFTPLTSSTATSTVSGAQWTVNVPDHPVICEITP
jgi:hypothetical protein